MLKNYTEVLKLSLETPKMRPILQFLIFNYIIFGGGGRQEEILHIIKKSHETALCVAVFARTINQKLQSSKLYSELNEENTEQLWRTRNDGLMECSSKYFNLFFSPTKSK